ncbi:MAG: hypothetical protein ACUVSX_15845 [Aggregatilineales bacterium]
MKEHQERATRPINWTAVILASLCIVAWLLWQSFAAMSAETRGFLNGIVVGAGVMLIVAGSVIVLLARQYGRMIAELQRQLDAAHAQHGEIVAKLTTRLAAPVIAAAPPSPQNVYASMAPPLPQDMAVGNGGWTVAAE